MIGLSMGVGSYVSFFIDDSMVIIIEGQGQG